MATTNDGSWRMWALSISATIIFFFAGLYVDSVGKSTNEAHRVNHEQALILRNYGERLATQEERSANLAKLLQTIAEDVREIRNATVANRRPGS
jgi:hypothetical protein